MRSGRFLLLLWLLIPGILTGCWNSPPESEQMFRTYTQRISHVFDLPEPPPPDIQPVILPERRQFLTQFPPINIGLLESYQLRDCGLFRLISERNSILGKVQDQFHRLEYELKLLHQISICLKESSLPEPLKQKLKQIRQQKQARLPYYWLSLLYTSNAMRGQLGEAGWYQPEVSVPGVKPALTVLKRVYDYISVSVSVRADNSAGPDKNEVAPQPGQMLLTRIQEPLEKQRILGRLLFTMNNVTLQLNQITTFLTQHSNRIRCGKNRDNSKARYLKNVFHKYYIGEIQPYLADTDAAYLSLQHLLVFFQPVMSEQSYIYPIQTAHKAFRDSILKHIHYWQSFSERCNMSLQ
ncbi:DUF3080 family protein [Vibrio quintilis]|uniref:DUF3080 domain-containing protein n=1 Tax=Vibrio quintilis TaxID=1117707 RepID=A0A1M7YU60_9VIBR|nr:DUF3080 family protein [Vibrio quintilis]SHO56179.1 hypothetical protein VQ7734_01948 [Vibrio quintilis]